MIDLALEWFNQHRLLIEYLGIISAITLVATPVMISYLVVRIPEEYFLYDRDHLMEYRKKVHPLLWMFLMIAKNVLGIIFILAGIAMLVLPGQGIITILIGMIFIDFPMKRALEKWIVSRGKVLSAINWMRVRQGRKPLRIQENDE